MSAINFQENGNVLMHLYPKTNLFVEVTRPTALHLFSLVCRYNATIAKPGWSGFWPRIEQIERSMTVLFVSANSTWGKSININTIFDDLVMNTPQFNDFSIIHKSGRRKTLIDSVRKELNELYRVHLAAARPRKEVQALWELNYPKVMALLSQHHMLESLLADDNCYNEEYVFSVVHDLLLKHGHDVVQRGEPFSHDDWCHNDASLFANCIQVNTD